MFFEKCRRENTRQKMLHLTASNGIVGVSSPLVQRSLVQRFRYRRRKRATRDHDADRRVGEAGALLKLRSRRATL